jgi:predicted transcriptional regulator
MSKNKKRKQKLEKLIRKEGFSSFYDLAKKSGIDYSNLYRAATGEKQLSALSAVKLLKAGVSLQVVKELAQKDVKELIKVLERQLLQRGAK